MILEKVEPMLVQEVLIAKVRELCQTDERLDAALMYGSFASGEADEYSDVEFWLFFDPQRRGEIDPRAWCAQIAPRLHHVHSELGTDVVVFSGLVRGEFHFATAGEIEELYGRFANWLVLAHHVACRGEHLRAWDALDHAHRYLLWMAGLVTGHTEHWLTPPRPLFTEIDDALSRRRI